MNATVIAKQWNLDPKLTKDHTALVLFDVLQSYVHPADPAKAALLRESGTIDHLQQLLAGARDAGLRVFFAAGDHAPDGSDSAKRLTDADYDLTRWGPEHPQTFAMTVHHGSRGAQVADELTPSDDEIMVYKHRWSAFYQTSLELALRARGLDTIVLAGISSDVGVAATAYAARDLDFGIVFVRDASFSGSGGPANHAFMMERVFPRMGRVMTTEEAVALMT
jgi:ureidoacrylate peracid hydrolase